MSRIRPSHVIPVVTLLGALAIVPALARPQTRPGGQPPAGGPQMSAEALIEELQSTPGCLGTDAGRWQSGKQTIAAWFEDKQAVKRWYYSEVHQGMMSTFTPAGGKDVEIEHRPMQYVPDDVGPVMVLATITPAATPVFDGLALPVSQISIELFKPLPGGAHLGGRLAPPAFEVPHMRDYTPPSAPDEAGASTAPHGGR